MRKDRKPRGREGEIGLEHALELQERLVVERDVSIWPRPTPASARQYSTACCGKRGVVLLPGESLLLRRGHDMAVVDEGRRAVVVVGRNAQDAHESPA